MRSRDLVRKELQMLTDNMGVNDLEYLVASLIVKNENLEDIKEEVLEEMTEPTVIENINCIVDLDDWIGGKKVVRKENTD